MERLSRSLYKNERRENTMMHQRIEPYVTLDDRPERETIIEKDEIVSLVIDTETLSTIDFYEKYFLT
jgi:hypothetical protein